MAEYLIVHSDPEYLELLDSSDYFDLKNANEVYEATHDDLCQYRGMVLFCELLKDRNDQAVLANKHYGIQLAQYLRNELKLRLPILFTSCLSRVALTKGILKHAIVNAVGHSFLQLPCHPNGWIDELQLMRPLNEIELNDVRKIIVITTAWPSSSCIAFPISNLLVNLLFQML